MRPALLACALSLIAFDALAATPPTPADLATTAAEVKAAEIAFAKTMADRKLDRFGDFVADDAVFNGRAPHIGKAAVIESWKAFFDGPQAPFSWAPDAVAPTADGRYAISTGLARDPAGKVISRFTSICARTPMGTGAWSRTRASTSTARRLQRRSSARQRRRPERLPEGSGPSGFAPRR